MEKQYLVVNKSKFRGMDLPYKEMYKLFTDPAAALSHAKSVGYENPMLPDPDWTPGMANMYRCGDIWIELLAILPEV